MLLGRLGNPWSLQDGRAEVDPNPVAPARYLPMVNPEIPAEPTARPARNEENGRRIHITKKMVSEFGATLVCLVIGQPQTEECRARITARIETCAREAARRQSEQEKRICSSGNDGCCAQ